MTDPLNSSLYLGRWCGVQVRLHIFLLIFLVMRLLGAALDTDHAVLPTAAWLILLLLALAVHETGHAVMAWLVGAEPEEVRLWPLGNFLLPHQGYRSQEGAWRVALAGPAVNLVVALTIAIGLNLLAGAEFIFSPFGNGQGSGAPLLAAKVAGAARVAAEPFTIIWIVGWFGWLNWLLFLANLIPALPFDGGRVLRSVVGGSSFAPTRDSVVVPHAALTSAVLIAVAGVLRMLYGHLGDGLTLGGLALLIELLRRQEARMLEEGGFYDDTVFGYDFSEGYTSLEGSAAKVQPYRESALKRWRRRRSELRRQRRQAREAAQERRMDEILDKLHREGKAALSDEEHRFLVRVSRQIRSRPKSSSKE